jgi:apolipoprotein N-acyltransferase
VAALSAHGSNGSLAYTQMDNIPGLQVAALGGAPAVTFVVCLFPSLVALGLSGRPLQALAAPIVIVVASLAWGRARIGREAGDATVPVALVASDGEDGVGPWAEVWPTYTPGIAAAAAAGARVVVLPEKIARVSGLEGDKAVDAIGGMARRLDLVLVVGVLVEQGGRRYNRALVADPTGHVSTYDKRHPVPGWEDNLTAGAEALVFDAAGTRLGVAICKDMDFASLGREQALAGARLVLVPGWDFRGPWGSDGWAHGRLAVLRGVEGGYTVARSPRVGQLVVSDRFGRPIAEASTQADVTVVTAAAPLASGPPTLYARIGDVFGWSCLAAFVAMAVAARRRRSA